MCVGLIGAGRIGTAHAETLARRVPGIHLSAIADPRPGAAAAVAGPLGARSDTDPDEIFSDPEIEAIVIAASSPSHSSLILGAIAAGKAVFCEKPMAETFMVARICKSKMSPPVTGRRRSTWMALPRTKALVVSRDLGSFGSSIPHHMVGAALDFFYRRLGTAGLR